MGLLTRILATLDALWLVGVVVYVVLQALGLVPSFSAGTYIWAHCSVSARRQSCSEGVALKNHRRVYMR